MLCRIFLLTHTQTTTTAHRKQNRCGSELPQQRLNQSMNQRLTLSLSPKRENQHLLGPPLEWPHHFAKIQQTFHLTNSAQMRRFSSSSGGILSQTYTGLSHSSWR